MTRFRILLLSLLAAVWVQPAGAAVPDSWLADLEAVEAVYWQHRDWPEANPGPKPAASEVLDRSLIRRGAERTLAILTLLDRRWGIRADDALLQIELERIAANTRAPRLLEDLFAALDDDPSRIARAVALPALVERIALDRVEIDRERYPWDERTLDDLLGEIEPREAERLLLRASASRLPTAGGCSDDSWATYQVEPTPRGLHSAVWTGSEMIVWGGNNENEYYNSGGVYTPATDSWRPTTLVGAPIPRTGHRAVWSGTEMIVWGGDTLDGNFQSDTGARYDPVADSWTPMAQSGAPGARSGHVMVWTGSRVIVWGGYAEVGAGPGALYDPATDSWSNMNNFPSPEVRTNATGVWTGNELLILGGGEEGAFDPSDLYRDLWRYSPATNSWTQRASIPGEGRAFHTAVWTGTEMLVWGGISVEYDEEFDEYYEITLDDGWRYHPPSNGWSPIDFAGPLDRYYHSAVWTGSEMLIFGGYNGFDSSAYNPLTDSWRFVPTGSSPGSEMVEHSLIWADGEAIVWGGYGNQGVQSRGGRWNPASNGWSSTFTSGAPPARSDHSAVWTGAEMLIHGGNFLDQTLTYRYDPALNAWSTTSPSGLSGSLSLHTAVWSGTEMIVWGGINGSAQGDGGRYNPTTDTWTAADQTNAPSPRWRHVAVWTGSEMMVWGGSVPDSSGGRYDPVTDSWTQTSQTNAPSPRNLPVAVATGSEVLVWGGYAGSTMLGDGARYDPATDGWTPMSLTDAPSPRQRHSGIWSGSEFIVWGGSPSTANTGLDTGARYDPTTDNWTPTTTVDAPEPRGRHTAVWTGSEMIVWGGRANAYWATGGRYDPTTDSWSATTLDQGPRSRIFHTAVWSGEEMMIFGGEIINRVPIGARYCAASACSPTDWYADTDGDGFGDAGDVVNACDAPGGYVDTAGDCDDALASAWSAPSPTRDLVLGKAGATATLTWSAPQMPGGTALQYDLLRADAPSAFATALCVESDESDLTANDPDLPLAGASFFYLPRAISACPDGEGALGAGRIGTSCP